MGAANYYANPAHQGGGSTGALQAKAGAGNQNAANRLQAMNPQMMQQWMQGFGGMNPAQQYGSMQQNPYMAAQLPPAQINALLAGNNPGGWGMSGPSANWNPYPQGQQGGQGQMGQGQGWASQAAQQPIPSFTPGGGQGWASQIAGGQFNPPLGGGGNQFNPQMLNQLLQSLQTNMGLYGAMGGGGAQNYVPANRFNYGTNF